MIKKKQIFYILIAAFIISVLTAVPLYAAEKTEGFYGFRPFSRDREITIPDDISFADIKNSIVEKDGSEKTNDYSSRAVIPRRFPGEDLDETKQILEDRYPLPRLQSPFDDCWAFSVTGCAEFYAINHGLSDNNVDLSEGHLALGIYRDMRNPVVGNEDAVSEVIFNGNDRDMLNLGGDRLLAAQYLSKGFGFIKEEDLPYPRGLQLSGGHYYDPSYIDEISQKSIFHMTNYMDIPIRDDEGKTIEEGTGLLKEAIMQNGAAAIGYHDEDDHYNSSGNAYYYDRTEAADHAVAVVGWDDGFPVSSFKAGNQPEAPGAWLVRNSWYDKESVPADNMFSHNGYFWISYEDKGIFQYAGTFEVGPCEYDNNYYYDTQIHAEAVLTGSGSAANIYKVQDAGNEKLKEVVIETFNVTDYEISVYTDLKDNKDPVGGSLVESATTRGRLNLPGIYTIPLNKPVVLKKGSYYSIVVKTADESVIYEYTIDDFEGVKANCGLKRGQSFYLEGSSWKDLCDCEDFDGKTGNFVINAHTVNTDEKATDPVSQAEKTLKSTVSENISAGSDVVNIAYNNYVEYDGRSHIAVRYDEKGEPYKAKDSGSKVYDVGVTVTLNGEVLDPSAYSLKTKNNKASSVSTDGITPIITEDKKKPYFTVKLKLKGDENKGLNKVLNDKLKSEKFYFGIIPAELKQDQVDFGKKVKKDKGTGQYVIKKLTYTPSSTTAVKAKKLKLKYKKKEKKTDFTTVCNADGSVTVTGKNNFYGSVIYKK